MDSLEEIWNQILDIIAKDITPTAYNTWFSDCTAVDLSDCKLVLHTSSDFKRGIIMNRFGDVIRGALYDLFSCDFELDVLAGDEILEYTRSHGEKAVAVPGDGGVHLRPFCRGPLEQICPRRGHSRGKQSGQSLQSRCLSTATPASARPTCCWP